MGLILQIIGVLISLGSLIYSIIAIVNGTSTTISIILLVVGATLVRLGRKIYNDGRKS